MNRHGAKPSFEGPKTKLIYVYQIDDEAHAGCLKVGETSFEHPQPDLPPDHDVLRDAARRRIDNSTRTAAVAYQLVYTETAFFRRGENNDGLPQHDAITDKQVHNVLLRSGIERVDINNTGSTEWFRTDIGTVKNAIAAAKQGRAALHAADIGADDATTNITLRQEQRDAIEKTKRLFQKKKHMLWNAKMRFGKTLTALHLIKECGFRRSIIVTHRPAVNDNWFDDFHLTFRGHSPLFLYGSRDKGETFGRLELLAADCRKTHYVYFASLQDLRGSKEVTDKGFDKNNDIFGAKWDLVVIDEAHEGVKTDLGDKVLAKLAKTNTRVLNLSGTPYNLVDDFAPDQIFTWDYTNEQNAKAQWELMRPLEHNPYAALPKVNIYTYRLGEILAEQLNEQFGDHGAAFSFREFFRTDPKTGLFERPAHIQQFLDLLTTPADNNYPFANERFRDIFRHTLWRVPGVKEAHALSLALQAHRVFGQFNVVNVAGEGDDNATYEANMSALQMVNDAIGPNPDQTYSITLTCGRLCTGATVKAWTGVLYLAGQANTAATSYMQTIFRAQTPATIGGRVKDNCYVFDFAPDRTLQVIADVAAHKADLESATGGGGKTDDHQPTVKHLAQFLNFCPVIAMSESKGMERINTDAVMSNIRRAHIERVIRRGFEDARLYKNKTLLNLGDDDLTQFQDLKKIVGATKAMPRTGSVDINNQGLGEQHYDKTDETDEPTPQPDNPQPQPPTPDPPTPISEEEKLRRKNRDAAVSILRGISIRMPLMIYGADIDDQTQRITIDNFATLVDDESWDEFMPRGVTKAIFAQFTKYYDPVVFEQAGRRIREMARGADQLFVEDRIERITAIFDTFRNPDKETVLTPWRVVNLHMGKAFGGYRFYHDPQCLQRATQPLAPTDAPDQLPHGAAGTDIFHSQARLLEINSKSGLYPLYAAYSIYRALADDTNTPRDLRAQLTLWDTVLADCIYVVCKTPMAAQITRRTLAGFRHARVNALHMPNLTQTIQTQPQQLAQHLAQGASWPTHKSGTMKFDAVFGNPPYQINNNGDGNGADPIYHCFIDTAMMLSDIGSLIHPARFLSNAGKTPKEWNDKMLKNKYYTVCEYWADSKEVFQTVDIKGGIAVTLWDKNKEIGPIGVFSPYEEIQSILNKCINSKTKRLSEIVYQRDLYRLTPTFHEENDWAKHRQSKGHTYDVGSNIFSLFPEVFHEKKPKTNEPYALLFGRDRTKRCTKYIKESYLKLPDNYTFYKVLLPKSNGSGALGEVLSTPVIGNPGMAHTLTFLSIGCFKTEQEAYALLKYIKSKFLRLLLDTLKVTQDNPRETWSNVPLQDFTPGSDIDWRAPGPEVDRQLYDKYGLTEDERAFIEARVAPMP